MSETMKRNTALLAGFSLLMCKQGFFYIPLSLTFNRGTPTKSQGPLAQTQTKAAAYNPGWCHLVFIQSVCELLLSEPNAVLGPFILYGVLNIKTCEKYFSWKS